MSEEIEKNNVMNFPSEDMDNLRILKSAVRHHHQNLAICISYREIFFFKHESTRD